MEEGFVADPFIIRAWVALLALLVAIPTFEEEAGSSFDQGFRVSKHMVELEEAADTSLVVLADHSIELECQNISFGDVSRDQIILVPNQNSDLNDYYYYPLLNILFFLIQ